MFKKLYTTAMAAAIFASVLGVGISGPMVASAAGTGPSDALAPTSQWTAVAPSQQTWYAFNYGGDSSQILIRMGVDSSNPASFEVWTADQIQQWVHGDTVTPVGRGTADDYLGGDLVWTGNFNEPGTYYVIVSDTSMAPASYSLQISGDAVSFPKATAPATTAPAAQPAAPAAPAAQPAAQSDVKAVQAAAVSAAPAPQAAPSAPAAAPAPAAPAKSGKGPDDALAISGKWTPLSVGQQTWYAFPYSGDGSQITLRMSVDQSNAATFDVRTPADMAQWAQDGTIVNVGSGSTDDSLGGDLVWSGNFNAPGTYFVVVTQTGSVPANYQLTIN